MKRYLYLLIPLLFFLILILGSGSFLLMKKMVAFLILPTGAVWVLLTFVLFWPKLKRSVRVFFFGVWIIYTIAGNPLVGNLLLRSLESPYVKNVQPGEPLDILFVLGGGTVRGLADKPRVGSAGDRVITAARLYKKGETKKLGASGRSITEIGSDRILAEETVAIWSDLGIPDSDMIMLPDPCNTREEIDAYINYLRANPDLEKVGICTSAWHLKRAEKIWRKKGLSAQPVPSDFRSRPIPVVPLYLIPRKRGFAHVQIALWEYLGILLG